MSLTLRINEKIRVREVRLISATGEQVGIVLAQKALEMAKDLGLDLVEVSPDARPPVCKILDYGKYKYEHEKREKDAKKKQHVVVVKEMKIRPKIGIHDLEIKLKHTMEFLDEGNRVRLVITFRGREMANQELGRKILNIALTKLAEKAVVETPPRFEGNNLGCLLAPKPGTGKDAKPKPAPASDAEASKPAPAAAPKAPAA